MSTDGTLLRGIAYEQDGESDQLISRATWSLKLSGLVFAGLLVLGRSASSGNVVEIRVAVPAYGTGAGAIKSRNNLLRAAQAG